MRADYGHCKTEDVDDDVVAVVDLARVSWRCLEMGDGCGTDHEDVHAWIAPQRKAVEKHGAFAEDCTYSVSFSPLFRGVIPYWQFRRRQEG